MPEENEPNLGSVTPLIDPVDAGTIQSTPESSEPFVFEPAESLEVQPNPVTVEPSYATDPNSSQTIIQPQVAFDPITPLASPGPAPVPVREIETNKLIKRIVIASGLCIFLLLGSIILIRKVGTHQKIATNKSVANVQEQSVALEAQQSLSAIKVEGGNPTLVVNGHLLTLGPIEIRQGDYTGQIVMGEATASQKYTLPNSSGEFCLDSNNCGYAKSTDITATSINSASGAVLIQGTPNQITVTASGKTVTVATAQDIATSSSPTFNGLTTTTATINSLAIQNGTQNGYTICDSSNNCVANNVTTQGNIFNGANQLVQINGAGELPAVNAVNLININASNIASGTLADARLSNNVTLLGNTFNGANQLAQLTALGYLPALNGSLVTAINASNIASGTLADARLSNNVALLSANQTFTGSNTFSGTVTAGTITSTGSLTVGNTAQSLVLRGNASTTLTANSGGFTSTIGFNGVPTGNVAYNFDIATTPGTYTICTTIGNCAGTGGGVTTLGGTTNHISKFTGSGSIGDTIITDTGSAVAVTPGSNGTNTFSVQNSLSANVLIVDTTNSRVAINQNTATYTLDVNGDINSATALRVGGNLVCVSTGCSSVGGSGFYVQNGTGLQTVANYNIQSANASNVVGIVRAAVGQTADLFQAQNSGGTPVAKITASGNLDITGNYLIGGTQVSSANLSNDANIAKLNGNQSFTGANTFTGSTLIQSAVNSTSAVQIQNALGTSNLLIADTTNTRIGIGMALPGYTLDVNGDINISTGSAYRINGVAICGPSSSCAPSSGSNNYIQNNAALQTGANFNIQSVNAGSAVGILRGAAAQTANLFEVQTSTPTTVFAINSSGNVILNALGASISGNYLCLNGSNQIAACSTSGSGAVFVQGGNSFGAQAVLGTNDNNSLAFKINGSEVARLSTTGTLEVNSTGAAGTVEKLRVNTPTTVDNLAASIIGTGATTSKGLVVQGVASQTADLLQLQNSSGVVQASFSANGSLSTNGVIIQGSSGRNRFVDSELSSGGGLRVGAAFGKYGIYAETGDVVIGSASGNVNIQNGLAVFNSANSFITSRLTIGAGSTTGLFEVNLGSYAASTVGQIIRANAAQTADLLQITNIGGTPLSGVDASGNFFLAAGQSLKVTGSNTFPSSPTEGQVYFRTDTKQLYVYENAKWQADRSTATLIVAASDSQNKEKADYVATGTNDEAQINAAIAALPATGGSVVLLDGTYNLGGTVAMNKANVTLTGQGSSTVLKRMWNETVADTSGVITITASSLNIQNLYINGNKASYNNSNNHGIIASSFRNNITVTNSVITNSAGLGVYVGWNILGGAGSGKVWQFENNEISSNTAGGFQESGNGGVFIVTNNKIVSNGGTGAGVYATNSILSNNYIALNNTGVSSSAGVTITGNSVTGNTLYGILNGGLISNNIVSSNGSNGIYASNGAIITNNRIISNTGSGVYVQGSNMTITGNYIYQNLGGAVGFNGSFTNNIISNNRIEDNGGSGVTFSLYITGDNNQITGNVITDTAGTGSAIRITGGTGNYLSGNTYSGTGATSISDSGTGTIYANQMDSNGNINMRGSAGVGINTLSPTASLQNAGGLVNGTLSTPAAPGVTTQGTAGATSYTYAVTATDGLGETVASTGTTIATGNATLNGTNFNRIVPARVSGAVSYKIYRTASGGTPATTGYIGTLAGGAATFQFDDTGLAGSGSAPGANTTGSASIATYLGVNNAAPANRLAVNTATTADSLAQALVSTGATTNKGIVVQGVASQTADLQQWQDSTGSVLARVQANGIINASAGLQAAAIGVGVAPNAATASININVGNASYVGQIIRGATSQTAYLQQWQRSDGLTLLGVDASGNLVPQSTNESLGTAGNHFGEVFGTYLNITSSGAVGSDRIAGVSLGVTNSTAATWLGLMVKGFASQSANLQEWQNSAGTVLAFVSSTGLFSNTDNILSSKRIQAGNSSAIAGAITAIPLATNEAGIIARGLAAQTGNLQEWQNSAGTVKANVTAAGKIQGRLSAGNTAAIEVYNDNDATSLITLGSGGLPYSPAIGLYNGIAGTSASLILTGAVGSVAAINTNFFSVGATASTLPAQLQVFSTGTGTQGIVVKGFSGQTADLQQWQNSAGTVIASVNQNGAFKSGQYSSADGTGTYLQANASNAMIFIGTVAGAVVNVVRGAASQTGDLQQWQDSSGTVLDKIDASGNLTVKNGTFNGTLTVNGHIITANTSGSTTVAAGANAGTGATTSIAGNDTSGMVTINAGTGAAAGVLATITFANAYGTAPRVVLTPANGNGSAVQYFVGASGTATYTIDANNTPTSSVTYIYYYQIMQ